MGLKQQGTAPTELFELEERVGDLLGSQRAFIFSPDKFSAIAGGFGSGKTRAGVLKGLVLSSIFPGNQGIIGRYRGSDLEDSTKPVFFEVCPPSWIRSYNKQSNTVTLRNGSRVFFRHIHDPKAAGATKTRRVGANLGWFFVDQMEEIEIEHWNALISRLRNPIAKKHFGFGALNPKGHDWIWKMFFQQFEPWDENGTLNGKYYQILRPSRNILGVAVNSEENRKSSGGFVDDDYYDSMLGQYSPEWIERYIRGSFDDFSGKIYRSYVGGLEDEKLASVHNIEPFPIPRHWDLKVGIDVGGDSPWAVVPEYIDEFGNTIVTPGLKKANLTTKEVADWIKSNLPWNESRTTYVIDWENKVVMLELAQLGIHCQPARKEVLAGVLKTQGYFHVNPRKMLPGWYLDTQPDWMIQKFADKGSPRTFVFKTFEDYRRDHDEYVWDENKINTPKKTNTKRFDTCDADRYVKMSQLQPSKPAVGEAPYERLKGTDEGAWREWQAFDKRMQARQVKMKGGGGLLEADVDELYVESTRGFRTVQQRYDWEA